MEITPEMAEKYKGDRRALAGIKNLTPMKKGTTLNPHGKPKGKVNLTTILRALLDDEYDALDPRTKEKTKLPAKTLIMYKLLSNAMKGDIHSLRTILDRIDGKQVDTVVKQETYNNMEQKIDINNYIEKLNDDELDDIIETLQPTEKRNVFDGAESEGETDVS